jgi:hypothetical protein
MPLNEKQMAKFDLVCERIAGSSLGLRAICAAADVPSISTFRQWLADEGGAGPLAACYAQAKEVQADSLADEIIEVADDARNDWMESKEEPGSGWKLNGENIQRSKLRIDTRKWLAAKLAPKKYGDRQTVDINHGLQELSDTEIEARAHRIAERVGVVLPDNLITPDAFEPDGD